MMKRIKKTIIASAFVVGLGALTAGCASATETAHEKGPDYDFTYNAPYRAECDSFMEIDGKLNEAEWKDKEYLRIVGNEGNDIKATTVFTEKGVYIGVYVEDSHIVWTSRYAYELNTRLIVNLVKGDEVNYNDKVSQHPARHFEFAIDAKNTLSKSEHRYDAASYFEGELNGDTSNLSAEIFMPWSEMGYTEEELGDDGMPDNVKLMLWYYSPKTATGFPNFMAGTKYKCYYEFDKNGATLPFDYNSTTEELGYSLEGLTPGNNWIVDNERGTACNPVDVLQLLYFRKDSEGNAVSKASHYLVSTKVQIEYTDGEIYPFAGILNQKNSNTINVYGIEWWQLSHGEVYVSAVKAMDFSGWTSNRTFEKSVQKDYTGTIVEGTDIACGNLEVYLTVVKYDTYFYYFVNGAFVGREEDTRIPGECTVGLMTNGRATFSDWSFINYSENTEALDEYLLKYVCTATVAVDGAGSVNLSSNYGKYGDRIEITALPVFGYALSGFKINDEDKLSDFIENSENGKIGLTLTENVRINMKFEKFSSSALNDIFFKIKDGGGQNLVGAEYNLLCASDKRLQYKGGVNAKGNIVGELPKAGTYALGDGTITVGEEYTIKIAAKGYITKTYKFSVPADSHAEIEKEFILYENEYTASEATVNGSMIQGQEKVAAYDPDSSQYTYVASENGVGFVRSENSDGAMIASGDYVVRMKLSASFSSMFRIYAGANNYVEILTEPSFGNSKIMLRFKGADDAESWFSETTVGGDSSKFANLAKADGGWLDLTIVRYNNKIYIYSCDYLDSSEQVARHKNWRLLVTFDADGIVGGEGIAVSSNNKSTFVGLSKKFFDAGTENAFALTRNGGRVMWIVKANDDDSAAKAFVENPPEVD